MLCCTCHAPSICNSNKPGVTLSRTGSSSMCRTSSFCETTKSCYTTSFCPRWFPYWRVQGSRTDMTSCERLQMTDCLKLAIHTLSAGLSRCLRLWSVHWPRTLARQCRSGACKGL
jgi:hypothetical protein